jgi:hypothetical protein
MARVGGRKPPPILLSSGELDNVLSYRRIRWGERPYSQRLHQGFTIQGLLCFAFVHHKMEPLGRIRHRRPRLSDGSIANPQLMSSLSAARLGDQLRSALF